jgi:hypothetical protein
MKKALLKTSVLLLLLTTVLTGCKNDGDLPEVPQPTVNEPEVITTLTLNFTDANGVQPDVSATFRDPDGDGGQGPDIFDNIDLVANTTYNCTITLLDESGSEVEDMTVEIREEDDEHLFCFTPASGADVTVTRTDTDGTFEVGLSSQWATGAASTGTVNVVLKHQPDGLKDGTCAPGETDVEVLFITNIN